MAGVFLRSFSVFGAEFVVLSLILGGVFGFLFWFRQDLSPAVLYCGIFLVSFGLGILRYSLQETSRDLLSAGHIKIQGYVNEDPQRLEKFTRAVLKTKNSKILLTLPHYPEVKYGDILEVEGKLREPENFSDFDWKTYLAKDNIYFEMFLPEVVSRVAGGGWRLQRWLFAVKHKFLENISKVLPEPQAAFMAGLTAGERSSFPKTLEEAFRKVGVIHIVVLSGYNISIISDNIIKSLNYLPVAGIFRTLVVAGSIILFAIMTGASATIIRAAIMGILLLWARQSGRIYEALAALFFAGFLMVLVNPKILRFDASFQLSFMATLGLILLSPRIEKYFLWFPNFWKLREHLVATLSTQAFVLPLLLYFGNAVSWVSIPANLLILTAVPATMFFGFLAGLSGFFSYDLSQLFSWPAYLLLAYELWVVNIFSF